MLICLAVIKQAVNDTKPHKRPDIRTEAEEWLAEVGRIWVAILGIRRNGKGKISRLLYGNKPQRKQPGLWEERE
jgi:hypothetical protein